MKKLQKGFALEYVLFAVVIVVIAAVAITLVATHHKKSTNNSAASTTSSSTQTTKNTSSTSTQTTDPYAGWKTYCDNTYKYCFKYPTDWQITTTTASSMGSTGGASLLSPSKDVQISYSNAGTKSANTVTFNPVSIDKLGSANQDLSVVGGYIPTSGLAGNYYSYYSVVDTSLVSQYALSAGSSSKFLNNAGFTDKLSGSYTGTLVAHDAVTINTEQAAKDWFNTSDAKTGLLVLKSFYYQK